MLARLFMILPVFLAGNVGAAAEAADSAHDFAFTAIEGYPLPLSSFEGKVVLVVNTASLCGFTPQYADLQAIWERYRDRGFVGQRECHICSYSRRKIETVGAHPETSTRSQ